MYSFCVDVVLDAMLCHVTADEFSPQVVDVLSRGSRLIDLFGDLASIVVV